MYLVFLLCITGGSLKESVAKCSIAWGFDEFISYMKWGNKCTVPLIKEVARIGNKVEYYAYYQRYMNITAQIYNCYNKGLKEPCCMILKEYYINNLRKSYKLDEFLNYKVITDKDNYNKEIRNLDKLTSE